MHIHMHINIRYETIYRKHPPNYQFDDKDKCPNYKHLKPLFGLSFWTNGFRSFVYISIVIDMKNNSKAPNISFALKDLNGNWKKANSFIQTEINKNVLNKGVEK